MAQGASVDEIEKAIAQGADVNATEDGITPLMRAASTHSSAVSAELTRVLLANPTIQKSLNALTPFSTQPSGISHQTALAMATANGYVDTVKLLCSQPGIDPNIADSSGYTPLMWAITATPATSADLAKALLGCHSINVNAASTATIIASNASLPKGTTALTFAICTGNVPFAKLLCSQKEINLNLADSQRSTPLMYATATGFTDMVKLLISKGANLFATNSYRQTALDIANQYEQPACAKLLQDAMKNK